MKNHTDPSTKAFDVDIRKTGGYLYTNPTIFSAKTMTARHSREIHAFLQAHFPKHIRILDIGCGDGTFTIELATQLHPTHIIGFDIVPSAVRLARTRIPPALPRVIRFQAGDIYRIGSIYKSHEFDVAILRGVLHHLTDPDVAIKKISAIANHVLILEPNGYNPILKLIERYSPYHRIHGERSYWPPTINAWFSDAGYQVKKQRFVCITPCFFNTHLTKALKTVEPFFESLPFVHRFYCGANVVLYEKRGQASRFTLNRQSAP